MDNLSEKISMFLGFDPGRDKCGLAIMDTNHHVYYHQVIPSNQAIATILNLCTQFPINTLVMGDQTTAKSWQKQLISELPIQVSITLIDERYSSLEARDRYWKMYPPKGLTRLIPQGMRQPPRPVDDIVAILLIERYLAKLDNC